MIIFILWMRTTVMSGRVSQPWKRPLRSANALWIWDLVGFLKPGITATEFDDLYETFGDDPFIVAVIEMTNPSIFRHGNMRKNEAAL